MQNETMKELWSGWLQQETASDLGIRRPWCVCEGIIESSFYYLRKRLATHRHLRRS